jgi:hypothetical protein
VFFVPFVAPLTFVSFVAFVALPTFVFFVALISVPPVAHVLRPGTRPPLILCRTRVD